MISETASCYCGNISALVTLSRSLDEYQSRCCDCGFCTKHGAAYVSDPVGSLALTIGSAEQAVAYRQGSGAAEFWVCRGCGVLVSVTYDQGSKVLGAVNARALSNHQTVTDQLVVSPKSLNRETKTARWSEIWFQDVTITIGQ